MITLGDNIYATAPEVIVHEMAHHWYGDTVTPVDWRDMWMNEGMATFLQGVWMSEHGGPPMDELFADWASRDAGLRAEAGPPADYDPEYFGAGNVYYIPAVMWNELREDLGDEEFWRLVKEWPAANENGNADYDDITSWWSEQSGEDLSEFFDSWLLSDEHASATAEAAERDRRRVSGSAGRASRATEGRGRDRASETALPSAEPLPLRSRRATVAS